MMPSSACGLQRCYDGCSLFRTRGPYLGTIGSTAEGHAELMAAAVFPVMEGAP